MACRKRSSGSIQGWSRDIQDATTADRLNGVAKTQAQPPLHAQSVTRMGGAARTDMRRLRRRREWTLHLLHRHYRLPNPMVFQSPLLAHSYAIARDTHKKAEFCANLLLGKVKTPLHRQDVNFIGRDLRGRAFPPMRMPNDKQTL
eukprot:768590-Hanusia_phi.AAC.9